MAQAAPGIAGPVTVFEPTAAPLEDLKAHLSELRPDRDDVGRPTVIVDQFEAVFTVCTDEAQRRDFVAELCELSRSTLVILALRADFYDHAIRYPGLAAAMQSRQVVLGPMTAEQVHRAVTEPARLARVTVEDGLVGLLLADLAPPSAGAAYERGALPLLSHAMMATWERSRGGMLAIADYLASGGIKDALTQTAERAYGSLSAEQQQLARRLFLRLVHVADDLPPSRATVELGELRDWGGRGAWTDGDGRPDGDAERVLATFVDERMITVDASTAQITHDALLTAWPRLRSWIDSGTRDCAPAGGSPRARGRGTTPGARARRCGAAASSRSPGTGRRMRTTGPRCPRSPPNSSTPRSLKRRPTGTQNGAGPGGCRPPSPCSARCSWSSPAWWSTFSSSARR